jgi:hypothetical protein
MLTAKLTASVVDEPGHAWTTEARFGAPAYSGWMPAADRGQPYRRLQNRLWGPDEGSNVGSIPIPAMSYSAGIDTSCLPPMSVTAKMTASGSSFTLGPSIIGPLPASDDYGSLRNTSPEGYTM